jgi:hypothetical protein
VQLHPKNGFLELKRPPEASAEQEIHSLQYAFDSHTLCTKMSKIGVDFGQMEVSTLYLKWIHFRSERISDTRPPMIVTK